MTIEPDLAGLTDQPMVFAVYGRARVLEPYVGKGITVDNLTQLVDFVTGACSCQVKDANPGMDLLTAWDWNATAERLAAKDSSLDPAERWLMRAMMTVEPDLAGLADQPMVFAVYGRARVLEPYVGKGITVDNLSQLVEFVTGACSCQVKDANPGMDLLTAWNWDATAERLAAKDSSFGLAVGGYAEIGPKDPSAPAGDSKASAEVGKPHAASRIAGQASSGTRGKPVGNALRGVPERGNAPSCSPRNATEGVPYRSPAHPAALLSSATHEPPPFANRLAWRLGLGLLAGAVIVLAAGFVLVRHRGPV